MLGFLLTVLLVASPALAEAALAQTGKSASPSLTEPSLSEIVNAVQERYQRTTSFRATFEQEAYNKSLGRTRTANGRVSIVRPGKMRWQYVKPDKRLIVSDGQTLWLYFPENNQVMVGDATRQSGFVRVFLAGDGKLGEDFEIEAAPKGAAARDGQMAEANEYGLQLRPKNPNTNVTRMLLFVDRTSFFVRRVKTYDVLGNATTIRLSNFEVNINVPEQQFRFEVPPGVDVVTLSAGPPIRR